MTADRAARHSERFTRLHTLAARGATQGERDAAQRKLDRALNDAGDADLDARAEGSIIRAVQAEMIRKARR